MNAIDLVFIAFLTCTITSIAFGGVILGYGIIKLVRHVPRNNWDY